MAVLLVFRPGSAQGCTQHGACRNCTRRLTMPSGLRRSRRRLCGGHVISVHQWPRSTTCGSTSWGCGLLRKCTFFTPPYPSLISFGDTDISQQLANWQRYFALVWVGFYPWTPDVAISACLLLAEITSRTALTLHQPGLVVKPDRRQSFRQLVLRLLRTLKKFQSRPEMSDPGRDTN